MKEKLTRKALRKKVMKHVMFLLDEYESIPLSTSTVTSDGEMGEVSSSFVTKEEDTYFLYKLNRQNKTEYKTEKVSKEAAIKLIEKQFVAMDKKILIEELEYWKEYALTFEEKDHMIISPEQIQKTMSL